MASGKVLWTRNKNEDDEIWDDTEMIAAYDRAMSKIKAEMSRRDKQRSGETSANKEVQNAREWKQGDYCRCVYSGDNVTYEAKIKCIKGEHCTVHYIGYGNEECIQLSDLSPSEGKKARQVQQARARSAVHTSSSNHSPKHSPMDFPSLGSLKRSPHQHSWNHSPKSYPDMMRPQGILPPPPPVFDGSVRDDEALASMLMSWYMSGYHTGYYQAMMHSKTSSQHQGHHSYS
ncbi:survival motor neuron protein-like [Ornithodoros turicata]|uniref:survival motor neuron protein-like n=1 Tax=Ornithodoros turicata TaxID=34597 RepID=UPI003138C2A9